MHQTLQAIKALFGLAVTLAVMGWCLYRLCIWFGSIPVKRSPRRFKRRANR